MPETDAELVALALDGDQSAFTTLVQRYQKLVFSIIYHYLGRSGEVEDVAQEVFLRLYRSLDRFDPVRPMRHWVGRITANRCLDELRKRKTRKTSLFADLGEDEEERVRRVYESSVEAASLTRQEARDCLKLLQSAMDTLGAKDRMAFVMRELEDLPYSELAAMLDCSEVAARIRVSRARKALEGALESFLDG